MIQCICKGKEGGQKPMKKRQLKKGIKNFLASFLLLYITFIMVTIETLGNTTYNIILIISTILAIFDFKILCKYTNIFD